MKKNSKKTVRFITSVAIFGALSTIFYLFMPLKLPIFPGFLSIHFDEIPAFIAGYAFGPLNAFFVLVIKTLIKMPMTKTMTIGEISDLILSAAFVLPAVTLYKYKKSVPSMILGIAISFISQMAVASVVTTFAVVPVYMFAFGMDQEAILKMIPLNFPSEWGFHAIYIVFVALPFNAIKNAIVIAAISLVVFPLRFVLNKQQQKYLPAKETENTPEDINDNMIEKIEEEVPPEETGEK